MRYRIPFLSAVLASAFLLSHLSACTDAPADTRAADDLPERDYGGYVFRIGATEKDDKWYGYIVRTEETGEVLNDAIHSANTAVAERFGIAFSHAKIPNDGVYTHMHLIANAQAGDDVYDAALIHDGNSTAAMLQGVLRSVCELPHIDLTKPWWPARTVEALCVNGKMYHIANAMSYYGLHSTRAVFFHKAMMRDLGIPLPYDDVRAGTWYLDDLMAMTRDIYADLDNDGARSAEDRYGFAITGASYCWLESFGIDTYSRNGEGRITESFLTERNVNTVEKLNHWVFGGSPGVWYRESHTQIREDGCGGMFARGNVLMVCQSFGVITEVCADSDVEYGVVPMPKADEMQTDYYGGSVDKPVVIPITNTVTERTGIIIEAMSAEGWRRVQPAYTESFLKARYASDPDSVEMMDIIFRNRFLAGGHLYADADSRVQTIQDAVWAQGTSNAGAVSVYERIKPVSRARVAALNAFFFGETE